MTEKRLFGIVKGHREHIVDHTGRLYSDNEVANLLNELNDKNELLAHNSEEYRKLSIHFKQRNNELISNNTFLEKENEQLKKGMIGIIDKYIKNVECNPPSSARTYMKIKGALVNIREDLRNLICDLE